MHLVVDNYATHRHPNVRVWREKRPRFHLHFPPTSSSWLNMRRFRDLDDKAIRRGVFGSLPSLIGAIEEYLEANNGDPGGSCGPQPPSRSSRRSISIGSPSIKSEPKAEALH